MVTSRGGWKFDAALKALLKKLGSGKVVTVGYWPESEYPDGTKVALIAAIQNFGAPKRGIPPRPFFTNMIMDGRAEWPTTMVKLLLSTKLDTRKTLELMGQELEGELRQSIQQTNEPPLKPATIARKGHSKPLIAKYGLLFGQIKSKVKT